MSYEELSQRKLYTKYMRKRTTVVLLVGILCILVAVIVMHYLLKEDKEFEYNGWLNCQPMLSDEQAELCQKAEEANYPNIAY